MGTYVKEIPIKKMYTGQEVVFDDNWEFDDYNILAIKSYEKMVIYSPNGIKLAEKSAYVVASAQDGRKIYTIEVASVNKGFLRVYDETLTIIDEVPLERTTVSEDVYNPLDKKPKRLETLLVKNGRVFYRSGLFADADNIAIGIYINLNTDRVAHPISLDVSGSGCKLGGIMYNPSSDTFFIQGVGVGKQLNESTYQLEDRIAVSQIFDSPCKQVTKWSTENTGTLCASAGYLNISNSGLYPSGLTWTKAPSTKIEYTAPDATKSFLPYDYVKLNDGTVLTFYRNNNNRLTFATIPDISSPELKKILEVPYTYGRYLPVTKMGKHPFKNIVFVNTDSSSKPFIIIYDYDSNTYTNFKCGDELSIVLFDNLSLYAIPKSKNFIYRQIATYEDGFFNDNGSACIIINNSNETKSFDVHDRIASIAPNSISFLYGYNNWSITTKSDIVYDYRWGDGDNVETNESIKAVAETKLFTLGASGSYGVIRIQS